MTSFQQHPIGRLAARMLQLRGAVTALRLPSPPMAPAGGACDFLLRPAGSANHGYRPPCHGAGKFPEGGKRLSGRAEGEVRLAHLSGGPHIEGMAA